MKRRSKFHDRQDPYLSLGFGLIAYRYTLMSITCLFLLLSAVSYPLLQTYKKGGAIDTNYIESKFGNYSLANLGYSSVQCKTVPFYQQKMTLSCPYGEIGSIVPDGFGVTP